MKKIVLFVLVLLTSCFALTSCSEFSSTKEDIQNQLEIGNELAENQPTPTDIDYSLERYNLIRRAYWVNGEREKAISLPCEIEKPLGYIYLFTESGTCIGQFTVDGKVSSLNSYLTPEYYEWYHSNGCVINQELPDVDGSYGENDSFGIFFFTPDGKYIEWTGTYLYSDIQFDITDTVIK